MTDTIKMLALSGLAYEDEAPLGWKPLKALPEGVELQRLNAQNLQVLSADASLEEHRGGPEPKDESLPVMQELHRLEFKIDMLMRLLGNLLEQQRVVPANRKLRIYAGGLEWVETQAKIENGALGLVSFYLNRALPYPVELPVEAVMLLPLGGETTVRAEFRGLSPQVSDLLQKLIFRHHRRQVAESRASAKQQ